MTKLTFKERRFVNAYLGSAAGNGVKAARLAGYQQTEKALRVTASRLLAKANIRAAVSARAARETKASILTADERDEILSAIASGKADDHARIRAISELNKSTGRHSMKSLHEGKLTLEQVLTESRK